MPFVNRERPIYCRFKKGKILIKKDNIEKYHDAVEGRMVDLSLKNEIFEGVQYTVLTVFLFDGRDKIALQMNFNSGYARAFCSILPNINLRSDVNISGQVKEVDGKKRSTAFVSQHGKALSWAFTKDNPGDMPGLEVKKKFGKTVYNGDAQQLFFTELINNISKTLAQMDREKPVQAVSVENSLPIESDPVDDLPF